MKYIRIRLEKVFMSHTAKPSGLLFFPPEKDLI
jgi:hypothetical protein